MPQSINNNQPAKDPQYSGSQAVVENSLRRAEQLKRKKDPWLDQFQLVGEFVHMRKQEFQSEHTAGEFLTRDIFDPAAPKAAHTAASTLISLLWPMTTNRIQMTAPDTLEGTDEEKKYYEKVTKILLKVLDDPKANFGIATSEYMLDQVTFGTSGVEIAKDKKTKVRFKPWGVKHMSIEEGENDEVDTIYIQVKFTVQKIVKTYGIDNVSEKTREEFNQAQYDVEKDILIAIEPRITGMQTSGKEGNKGKPFSSVHIEMKAKHLLKESGFDEMPIKVARFSKLIGEIYGRSLAMHGMPDILQSNVVWESATVAIEKSMDPALGVYSDGVLGGGEIDTSAGAINVFNPSDQAKDRAPIFQLHQLGEFKQIVALLQDLSERISDHFLIDRLLDFNNESRMTATEATLRDRMRSSTLGQIFNRQIASYFTPTIERTFNLLLAGGHLGAIPGSEEAEDSNFVIPESIADLMVSGEDVFDLTYFTPAMRIMQAEEAEGILRQAELAGTYAEIGLTDALDCIDVDEGMDKYSKIVGAPSENSTSRVARKKKRDGREAQMQQEAEAEQARSVTEGMRNVGQSGLVPTEAPKREQ